MEGFKIQQWYSRGGSIIEGSIAIDGGSQDPNSYTRRQDCVGYQHKWAFHHQIYTQPFLQKGSQP